MVSLRVWLASSLVVLQLLFTKTLADGTGLIGFGKTLYNPTCTFACRNVIRKQKLTCTPSSSTENHGTAHNPVSTPPKCFVQDPTFLKTMALCIDVYCKLSDKPPMDLVEDYWASHLGTGTLGDYQYRPLMSYSNALRAARKDEEEAKASGNVTKSTPATVPPGLRPYQVTSPLGFTIGGSASLNQTRLVDPLQWQLQWNYLSDFERNEKGHSMMTIIIAVVAITLPILLSLLRHVPSLTRSHGWSYVNSIMIHPAVFGTRHRESVLGAIVPTRGQTLYIVLMSFLNIILLLAPYTITQPQASFTTLMKQSVSIVGNRAGTMAMGNVVALVLFSSRNSFLLYTTEWSYGTFLLFHRWLGYWAVAHTVIHSCMLWSYYVDAGTYAAEILRLYWVWGIVGTVAACALLLLSLPVVRKKMYELFVVSHIALSLLFLIGYYYHIWYVYEYKWGYEIWMFVAAGIWALERVIRIVRMATQGSCTALVTVVPDTDGDYVRIEVEGKDYKDGVTYLCFPTLSWRFWESHPFSVSGICADPGSEISQSSGSHEDLGSATTIEKEATQQMVKSPAASDPDVCSESRRTIFFARTRDGVTKVLKERAISANSQQIRVRVLVDGPYNHSGRIQSQIARCGSVICIAGGVGITACLPILKEGGVCDKKLFWSSRKSGLVAEVGATLSAQGASLKVETLIGERFDLDAILNDALRADESNGVEPVAIVVSGPPALADNVRQLTTQIARTSGSSRAYVLVDEAFGW